MLEEVKLCFAYCSGLYIALDIVLNIALGAHTKLIQAILPGQYFQLHFIQNIISVVHVLSGMEIRRSAVVHQQ